MEDGQPSLKLVLTEQKYLEVNETLSIAGYEIRISLNDNKFLTSIQSATLTENENVCVQAIFQLSRSAVYDNFDSDIHWEFLKVCTTGTVHISKWSVGEHTNKGRETSTSDVVWYVRYVSG